MTIDQPSVCWIFLAGNVPGYLQSQGVMAAVLGCAHSCVPNLNWQLNVIFFTTDSFILWVPRSEMYINSSARVQWWPTMFWYFVSAPAFNSSSTIAEWPALQTGHGSDEVDHFAQKKGNFVGEKYWMLTWLYYAGYKLTWLQASVGWSRVCALAEFFNHK